MDWIVSIILFIVALGLLICLHELGHFSMAKLFNVYCHEFSIGFGPALLHKRKQGKETYFSIRAIPLGGYVSMYGEEDVQPEEGLNLPKERSLEGIRKWKKAIIISAGVVVNALLAIVIFSISNLCFPTIALTNNIRVSENTQAASLHVLEDDALNFKTYILKNDDGTEQKINEFVTDTNYIYVLDDDVKLEGKVDHYVLTYHYYSEKTDNKVNEGLGLYVGILNTSNENFANLVKEGSDEPFYVPDVTKKVEGDASFTARLPFKRGDDEFDLNFNLNLRNSKFDDIGLSLARVSFYLPFDVRFKNIWSDFGSSAVAVGKGIVTLFSPGGINQMSGLVGIFTTSKQVYSTRSFSYYLYLWGFISVNLAIFNLLPFPGLDGWQLLVTLIEGVSKKKIPNKFKTIMTLIGFGLLLILTVAILVVDIKRLI